VPRKYLLPLFLLIQVIVLQVVSFFLNLSSDFTAKVFMCGFHIAGASRWEALRFLSAIVFMGLSFSYCCAGSGSREKHGNFIKNDNFLQLLSFVSVFYFLFYISWATNYYRVPLFDKMNIQREYSDADLLEFTTKLIAKTNAIQLQIAKNKNTKIDFPYSQEQVFQMNLNGYGHLAQQYPYLKYEHESIKKSLISLPLTYMGFAGYLNPFTNEAQVNYMLPMYTFPTTATHEMAHQLGYASESECNFIGFLASIKNDDPYFQYSGYAFALRYCLHNWEIRNPKVLEQLLKTINPGILKNYKESENFWKQYETFIETGFKIF